MSETQASHDGSAAQAAPDVEIEIVDTPIATETKPAATQQRQQPARKTPDPLFDDADDYGPRVQKRIGKAIGMLRQTETQLAAERRRAAELERQLAAERASRFGERETAIKSQLEQTERELAAAHTDGDGAKQAAATRRMAELSAENTQVAQGKRVAEHQRQQAEQVIKQAPQDPVYSPAVQGWIDNGNDWFLTDPGMRNDALLQHQAALLAGKKADSPEYFEFIDARMRKLHPEFFDEGTAGKEGDADAATATGASQQQQPSRPAQPPPAAPRRAVVEGTAPKPAARKIQLTKDEMDVCTALRITPQQYAAQKAARGS